MVGTNDGSCFVFNHSILRVNMGQSFGAVAKSDTMPSHDISRNWLWGVE